MATNGRIVQKSKARKSGTTHSGSCGYVSRVAAPNTTDEIVNQNAGVEKEHAWANIINLSMNIT